MPSVAPFIRQQTLSAGVATIAVPPALVGNVEIVNTTGGDLTVQSDPNDATTGFTILAGFPKQLHAMFDPRSATPLYLTSVPGGTVVLIWY